MVTEAGDPIIAEGDYTSIDRGQPDSGGVNGVIGQFHIKGQLVLPR